MNVPATPASLNSVMWVPLGPEHSTELFDLLETLEGQDQALFRTSLQEVHQMLNQPHTSMAAGAYMSGRDAEQNRTGRLVAFGYVGLARSGEREALCHGGVHRDFRGIGLGEAVMRWQTERGRELLQRAFPGQEGRILHTVDAKREDLHGHLNRLGYTWEESLVELRRNLEEIPTPPGLPRYLEVVPWEEKWEAPTARAFKRAAAEMGGTELERWAALRQNSVSEWSFAAIDKSGDRAKVVGLLELGKYEQDWVALGWEEGYIDAVAVFDPQRRFEILGALVSAALGSIAENGLSKAAVGLDPHAEPDMMNYYLQLGFEQHVSWRTYALPVADPDRIADGVLS